MQLLKNKNLIYFSFFIDYSLKSLIPRRIRSVPIIIINQNKPPWKNIHAECRKLSCFPKRIQLYTEDAHAIIIAPMTNINPIKSSVHLFMSS